ncbi:sodium/bile acid cotransporter-like [Anguilla anguilla]|uniref:Hepatic sodium/bile acid cotransporter n=1 Tax=Anguilla anguilla TaxID=7936 RepID=A0A9D3MZL3_ANGAN|nr:sodium/bile acid cotransporter-like [Anguilla anguilla]XP_035247006.1 sodium/bile acid cotransporter-like [Anguilla anguilla]KAG5857600.1 hypothetical protein ANANG_G00021160 [Anguilla anguilla]
MDATRNQTALQYSGSNDLWDNGNLYNVTPHNPTGNMSLVFDPVTDKIVSGLTIIILCTTMVSLGCTMEVAKIKAYVVKPKGVAIALVAQFGIMPLTAFTLTKIFQVGPMEAVTILICGCCPGGNLSNLVALALEGDMNLSIVMTTFSTIMALGIMPLLLFLYCKGIPNMLYNVPYFGIVIALIMSILPCLIGIAINHWVPRYSPVVKKVGLSLLLIAAVVIGIIAGIIVGDTVWVVISPKMIAMASLMPLIGFLLGYIMSCVFRVKERCRRTIAVETGCQNIQLCSTILKVTFPPEGIGALFLFPVVYIFFQGLESLLLIIIFRCYKRFKPAAEEKPPYLVVEGKVQEVKAP